VKGKDNQEKYSLTHETVFCTKVLELSLYYIFILNRTNQLMNSFPYTPVGGGFQSSTNSQEQIDALANSIAVAQQIANDASNDVSLMASDIESLQETDIQHSNSIAGLTTNDTLIVGQIGVLTAKTNLLTSAGTQSTFSDDLLLSRIILRGEYQTYAYTDTDRTALLSYAEYNTRISAVEGKTVTITVGDSNVDTTISGMLHTNYIRLWNRYHHPAYLQFPDLSQQFTAFTNDLNSQLQSYATYAQRLTDLEQKTLLLSVDSEEVKSIFAGDVHIDQIVLRGEEQTYAYTDDDRTALLSYAGYGGRITTVEQKTTALSFYHNGVYPVSVLNGLIESNFISLYDSYGLAGKITFGDSSVQTTAFTDTHETQLMSVSNRTAFITSSTAGAYFVTTMAGTLNCDIISIKSAGYIGFPDGTSQSTAYPGNLVRSSFRISTQNLLYAANGPRLFIAADSFTANTQYPASGNPASTTRSLSSIMTTGPTCDFINLEGRFTKVGRFHILVHINLTDLKWLVMCSSHLTVYSYDANGMLQGSPWETMEQGRRLLSSTTNEAESKYCLSMYLDVDIPGRLTFDIVTRYFFATNSNAPYSKAHMSLEIYQV
jgi:hypothetical protein